MEKLKSRRKSHYQTKINTFSKKRTTIMTYLMSEISPTKKLMSFLKNFKTAAMATIISTAELVMMLFTVEMAMIRSEVVI